MNSLFVLNSYRQYLFYLYRIPIDISNPETGGWDQPHGRQGVHQMHLHPQKLKNGAKFIPEPL